MQSYQAVPELDANGNAFAPLKPAEATSDSHYPRQRPANRLMLMPDPAVHVPDEVRATDQIMSLWME